jgi:hypothetical protein
MTMSPKPRTIAGGIAAAVLGGGVTAALLLGPSPTGATAPPSTDPSGTEETDDAEQSEESQAGDEALREALQPLVDGGVLTEEQADDLVEELLDGVSPRFDVEIGPDIGMVPGFPTAPAFPGAPDVPGGRHDRGQFGGRFRVLDGEVVAEAIGIDVADLREQLAEGATIAEIAEANGVDPQEVIDALVAEYSERVTDWVTGEQQTTTDDEPETTTATTEVEA